MSLADTARKLREEANDPGYQYLRKLRQMGDTYSWKAVNAKWEEIIRFEETAESLTLEGREKLCRMISQAHEMDELGKFCRKVVKAAEEVERKKKGEAAKIDIPRVERSIQEIREKWRAQKDLQISLEDIGRDGGADGCDDQGS